VLVLLSWRLLAVHALESALKILSFIHIPSLMTWFVGCSGGLALVRLSMSSQEQMIISSADNYARKQESN